MIFKLIKAVGGLLDLIEDFGAVAFMAVLMVILTVQVISRPLGFSAPWTEEAARIAFIWTVFLALPLAAKRGRLIYIKVLANICPQMFQPARAILEKALWLAVCLLWVWLSLRNVLQLEAFTPKTPVLGLNHTIVFAVMPLAFLLTARQAARSLLAALARKSGPS